MSPLKRLSRRERSAIAVMLGAGLGVLIAVCGWILVSNEARIAEVAQSRRDAVQVECVAQNERHVATVHALDVLLAQAAKHETSAQRKTASQARASTLLLIDALAPQENCAARVARLTEGP